MDLAEEMGLLNKEHSVDLWWTTGTYGALE